MNILQSVGLGLTLILAGMAMTISISLWPLGLAVVGVAVGLAGLVLLFFNRLFGRMEEEAKPPSPHT
jgi:hypothetical protein